MVIRISGDQVVPACGRQGVQAIGISGSISVRHLLLIPCSPDVLLLGTSRFRPDSLVT
jgi:hypothetical protein